MASKPYLTSNDLIETVKLNMSFPISQNTFSNEDILKLANHELFMSQVPSVLQYHEDYFSFREIVPLKLNKNRYDIPYRAIGNKLYDVYYQDENNRALRELSLVDAADKAFFHGGECSTHFQGGENLLDACDVSGSNGSYNTTSLRHFYIESNQIVLAANIGNNARGNLVFVYYLRPNNLVLDERAATCTNFAKEITIDNTTLIAGDKLVFGDILNLELGLTELIAGTDFAIGATSIATATNLNNAINLLDDYSSIVTGNIVTIKYEFLATTFTTTNIPAFAIEVLQGIEFDAVPANITNTSLVDFIKKKGGHRTYKFDVKLGKNVVSATIVKFKVKDIPEEFEVEDYICSQFECIIPQIPSDLHSLLAERTVARILEALGDQMGLQAANEKIGRMEAGQASMVDNRVEGSPRKVLNRNSFLRLNKGRNSRGTF